LCELHRAFPILLRDTHDGTTGSADDELFAFANLIFTVGQAKTELSYEPGRHFVTGNDKVVVTFSGPEDYRGVEGYRCQTIFCFSVSDRAISILTVAVETSGLDGSLPQTSGRSGAGSHTLSD
jgi:hypothetical protein